MEINSIDATMGVSMSSTARRSLFAELGGLVDKKTVTPETITLIGEVAAASAFRANHNGDVAGTDPNREQFIQTVTDALESIPVELRGEHARNFIARHQCRLKLQPWK